LVSCEKKLAQVWAKLGEVLGLVFLLLHPVVKVEQPEAKVIHIDVRVLAQRVAQPQKRLLLLVVVYRTCE
jgi:flagellar biogenesis protein FliO